MGGAAPSARRGGNAAAPVLGSALTGCGGRAAAPGPSTKLPGRCDRAAAPGQTPIRPSEGSRAGACYREVDGGGPNVGEGDAGFTAKGTSSR